MVRPGGICNAIVFEIDVFSDIGSIVEDGDGGCGGGVVVVDDAAAIGEVVVEAGSTCGSSGHHGIKLSARGVPCPNSLVSSHPFDWIEWALPIATQTRAPSTLMSLLLLLMLLLSMRFLLCTPFCRTRSCF